MDSPGYVRPAGNGPKGETGTAVKYLKKQRAFKARRFFDTTSIGRGSAPHGGGGSLQFLCLYYYSLLIYNVLQLHLLSLYRFLSLLLY